MDDSPAPIETVGAEVERVGYECFDVKSFLLGYLIGRSWPMNEERIRWHAEVLLSPNIENAHLPRPADS